MRHKGCACFRDQRRRGFRIRSGEDYLRAFPGQSPHCASTNATGSAGHKRDLSFESFRHGLVSYSLFLASCLYPLIGGFS
jgi:hypothetical protein